MSDIKSKIDLLPPRPWELRRDSRCVYAADGTIVFDESCGRWPDNEMEAMAEFLIKASAALDGKSAGRVTEEQIEAIWLDCWNEYYNRGNGTMHDAAKNAIRVALALERGETP